MKSMCMPIAIFERADLTPREKLLYAEVIRLSRADGECIAGNDHFAQLFSITNRQVSRIISHLKEAGLVRQTDFDGTIRTLVAVDML